MRPVSGFERPSVQWTFVAVGLALIAVAAAEAVALRRVHAENETMRGAALDAHVQQEQLESRLAHERATREALALELARRGSAAAPAVQPTLTLTPLARRGAEPPQPTVAQPAAAQSIQLRLVLPSIRNDRAVRYTVVIRTWSAGDIVWQRGGLSASTVDNKSMVTSFITGDVFMRGAYELALTAGPAASEVASYEVGVGPPK